MSIVNSSREFRAVNTSDLYDYIDSDGNLHINAASNPILIRSSDDLELSDLSAYPPGTLAHTAGWKGVWQKGADGSWVDMMEVDSDETTEVDNNA